MQVVTIADPPYALMSDWEAAFLREYVCDDPEEPTKARNGSLTETELTTLITEFNAFDGTLRNAFKVGYEARAWEENN